MGKGKKNPEASTNQLWQHLNRIRWAGYGLEAIRIRWYTWVWSDGATWSFADWYPGEPNNVEGDEDFREILTLNYEQARFRGKWNDHRIETLIKQLTSVK